VFADVVVHSWGHIPASDDPIQQVLLSRVERARVCAQLPICRRTLARLVSAHRHLVEAELPRESRLRLEAARLAQSPHALAEAPVPADFWAGAQGVVCSFTRISFRPHRSKHKVTSSI
jgi:hypothetical protein